MTRTTFAVVFCVLVLGCDDERETEQPAAGDETHEVAAAPPRVEVSEETAAQLEALGYMPTTPTDNPEQRGVTATDDSAARGVNLYSSRRRATAHLTDVAGQVLHEWHADDAHPEGHSWMHVEPVGDGAILALTKDHNVAKLDRDSQLIWRTELRAHHDLAVHEDGRVFVLAREPRELEHGGATLPVLADEIVILSAGGEVLETMPLVPVMAEHLPQTRLAAIARVKDEWPESRLMRPGGVADVLHTNSIAFLEQDIEGVAPKGSLLLSFRSANRIAILDVRASRVLWIWGAGELQRQHDATQLANGNILLFDNGPGRGHSRVLEVDPKSNEIVWSYGGPELYTELRGGAQELRNGNILITESDRGHAIEVTRDGEIVWEFWNPEVHGTDPVERDVIYRLNRFPRALFGIE